MKGANYTFWGRGLAVRPLAIITTINRLAIITAINIIAIITTISRIAVIVTINRIAIIATINRQYGEIGRSAPCRAAPVRH